LSQTTFKPWHSYVYRYKSYSDCINLDWIQVCLSHQAIEHDLSMEEGHVGGLCKGDLKDFEEKLKSLNGDLTYTQTISSENVWDKYIYTWDRAVCQYVYNKKSGDCQIHWVSNDPDMTIKFKEFGDCFKTPTPEGRVYVLVPCQGGLTTQSIGLGAVPLIEENYNKEVIEGFSSIVEDLNKPDPLGRLVIFDGPPGTGKTYLIRALLSQLPKHKFLLLPSNMADSLSGPELLKTLIEESDCAENEELDNLLGKKEKDNRPTVLVIEDADKCLSHRGADNISAISAILNLSDGIIGNLLDLRIICTTNVDSQEIDEALLRTGRLSARIEVNLLDVKQAKAVYDRVGGTKEQLWDKKFYSLSDIYAMSKGQDVEPQKTNSSKKKVGFLA
jgi:hypothetical protein